jgi:hypothetical protein
MYQYFIKDFPHERFLCISLLKMNSGSALLLAFWFRGCIHVDILYVGEVKQAGLPTCLAVPCQPQNYTDVQDERGREIS